MSEEIEIQEGVRPFQLLKQECRVCRKPRLNDGLKCPHCKSYQNPRAGLAPVEVYGHSEKNTHRVIK